MLAHVTAEELGAVLHGPQPPRIIDVREHEEFAGGHIRAAQSMPLSTITQNISRLLPNKSEPVVLYCDTGIRSHHAARLLRSMGYKNVREIMGGINTINRSPYSDKGLIANS